MKKKPIITLAIIFLFASGLMLTFCKSPSQKAEDAKDKVQDAREDLNVAKQKADTAIVKAANDEEWKAFKIDADAKIKKNELRISELKVKAKNEADKQRINALETRNAELKNRMNDYEKNKTDWESFTRDFNQANDELVIAIKDAK
jgi:hypothetical protein